jgi:hypothetical protein
VERGIISNGLSGITYLLFIKDKPVPQIFNPASDNLLGIVLCMAQYASTQDINTEFFDLGKTDTGKFGGQGFIRHFEAEAGSFLKIFYELDALFLSGRRQLDLYLESPPDGPI